MKKILLYIDLNECPDRNIFKQTDYLVIFDDIKKKGGNSGNKVWLSAMEQYMLQPDIEYQYYNSSLNVDYINNEFDMIVFPCANRLRNDNSAKNDLKKWGIFFNKIKIPVYVVGLGAQAESYEGIDKLVNSLSEYIKPFAAAIGNTGGDIAVRGEFTRNVLLETGYNNATVIGCPSLYRLGENLKIKKHAYDKFKPLLNIKSSEYDLCNIRNEIRRNPLCESIDQNIFYRFIYDENYIKNICDYNVSKFSVMLAKYPYSALHLLVKNRLKLFYDVPVWQKYLIDSNFTFSYSSRIHGCIMSVLSGIPTVLFDCDSRTREIAEYFSIPIAEKKTMKNDLIDIYNSANYDNFNSGFKIKYQRFKQYIEQRGISSNISNHALYDKKVNSTNYQFPPQIDTGILSSLENKLAHYNKLVPLTRIVRTIKKHYK